MKKIIAAKYRATRRALEQAHPALGRLRGWLERKERKDKNEPWAVPETADLGDLVAVLNAVIECDRIHRER